MPFANGYQTTTTGSLTSGATSVTVASTTGIPTVPFTATIAAEGANTDEIVQVTANASGTLTIVRGYETYAGNGASAHASGATIAATVTAGAINTIGRVLLESHTASTSASLDFTTRNASGQSGATFQSDFDDYEIEIVNVVPSTGTPTFLLEVSTDGGSTWDTTSPHYTVSHLVWSSGGSAVGGGNSSSIQVYPYAGRTMTTTQPCTGSLRLYNPLGTTTDQIFIGTFAGGDSVTSNATQTLQMTGSYNQVVAINALRFIMSSGNIASGPIRLYGMAK